MRDDELSSPYLTRIAGDWISYFSATEYDRDFDKDLWNPFSIVCEIVEHSPVYGWDLIQCILNRDVNDATLDLLSAGPLEDFIYYHGSRWLEWIEEAALNDARFRSLLAGVRQSETPDDAWARIVAARRDAEPFESD